MAKSIVIAVAHKPGILDPVGHGLKKDIEELGLAKVKNVLSAQLYRISGQLSADETNRIAKDLLCDPIIQEYRKEQNPSPRASLGPLPFKRGEGGGEGLRGATVDVWYKPGVTDVVGDSVLKGIRDLNIQNVQQVRTGMRYAFEGVTRREIAEKIALALLVNPLVHESTIHAD